MRSFLFLAIFFALVLPCAAQQFAVRVHTDSALNRALSGRLYVFAQPDTTQGLQEPDPFSPIPTFYIDVKNWTGNTTQMLDSTAHALNTKLNQLRPGYYRFRALLDINNEERMLRAPGNYYSPGVVAVVTGNGRQEIDLHLTRTFQQPVFRSNDTLKEVVLKSKLLSAFHGKETSIKGAVVLPPGYGSSSKEYPVVFIIPGWGGTHYDAQTNFPAQRYGFRIGKEKIYVYLNPETQTPYGLHAFVDSRVNGPWGKALVEELVPYLEKTYRIKKDPSQHFVMGQSSGGYPALWLQLNYPKAFGGCWAVSPDPVDFSEFISINIYAPKANFYYDDRDSIRPFFLWEGKYMSTIKNFCQFEAFIGDGGQMQSFEAEFGKPGKDGKPMPLYNRETGQIDAAVAAAWKPYDMGLFIQNNWKRLAKDLSGKVHVYAGADDNFYLDRAVKRLKLKAQSVNADVVAETIPNANHFTIWSPSFTNRVQQEIDQLVKE